ncbi:TIGR02996 domain-containing protein [Gemmata sp.]|uniref:TIGR02996 domain-containing protein n=1 Tax=Gemmata sp. TaxID=1914242 RepID=UPI003F6EE1F7
MHFTDEQPFLDAIFARYSDDGPRLVYADFLDEAGEPERAELVRVQLALARIADGHPRRAELVNREAELRDAHSARWTERLAGLVTAVEFRRGVPDSVTVTAGAFLDRGAELFRTARVRRLRLLDAADAVEKVAGSPLLAGVRELDLCGNELGHAGVARLVRSPHLGALAALDLGFNGLDDRAAAALARSSALVNLTDLALNDNDAITCAGVRELAASPFYAGLRALDLSGNAVGAAGAAALTAPAAFPHLRALRLRGNPLGDEGAEHLARSPLLARVVARALALDLRDAEIGLAGAAALAGSPAVARCAALDLSGNDFGDSGFARFVTAPAPGGLRTVRFARNRITDAGLAAVRGRLPALLKQLDLLDLSGNRLTRHGIGLLHAARGESGVVLDVSNNVQASARGEVPVAVGDVVADVFQGVAEAAELRWRIAHPQALPRS